MNQNMRSTILLLFQRLRDAAGEGIVQVQLLVARSVHVSACVITCMHMFIYGSWAEEPYRGPCPPSGDPRRPIGIRMGSGA